jgi:hypothetical protein
MRLSLTLANESIADRWITPASKSFSFSSRLIMAWPWCEPDGSVIPAAVAGVVVSFFSLISCW